MLLKYKKLHNTQFCEKKNQHLITNRRRRKWRKMNRRGERNGKEKETVTILFPFFIIPNLTHKNCKNQRATKQSLLKGLHLACLVI
jgi:hypothetical protein